MNLLRNEGGCLPLDAPENLYDRVLSRRSAETVCFLAFRNNLNQKRIAKLPYNSNSCKLQEWQKVQMV